MLRLPGAYDAAGAYYFIGINRKRPVIDPGSLLREYRGIKRARRSTLRRA
jgi:hypothetical protein